MHSPICSSCWRIGGRSFKPQRTQRAQKSEGVSTALLNVLKSKYEKVYSGISLSCRTDFDYASSVWRNFGFVPREKVRSRSYEVNYLNRWWYDFNQPDLFSVALTSKVKALLDMNIIVKLREAENADYVSPQEDPRGLLADWLTDEAELCIAPEAYNEIDRDENLQRAAKTRALVSSFTQIHVDMEKQKEFVKELEQIIIGKSDNDISDRKQIASCIVSQTPYFITYDEGLMGKSISPIIWLVLLLILSQNQVHRNYLCVLIDFGGKKKVRTNKLLVH